MVCFLFLTEQEKESLGVFVKTPFINYNKSKEKLDALETTEYHKMCVQCAVYICAQLANIENRIDTKINMIALQNVQKNKTIFPFIANAVLLCVKQQLALRGHRDK